MKIGILGSGVVARTLAAGFLGGGDDVMLGTREPEKLAEWAAQLKARVASVAEAAAFGEIVVLAVKGAGASAVLRGAGESNLRGKIVIDTTNPIADAPPTHGVLKYFTTLDDSLMERLQREFPHARLVKAFNSVGNGLMIDPQVLGGPPTMFICGNDEPAKAAVRGILERFGWDVADMGAVEAARAIEPLCILWCIPAFIGQGRTHAFKLVR